MTKQPWTFGGQPRGAKPVESGGVDQVDALAALMDRLGLDLVVITREELVNLTGSLQVEYDLRDDSYTIRRVT